MTKAWIELPEMLSVSSSSIQALINTNSSQVY